MKKVLLTALILSIASLATAGLTLTGIPASPVNPGNVLSIGILSDGRVDTIADGYRITIAGPSSWNLSAAVNTINPGMILEFPLAPGMIFVDLSIVLLPVPPVPAGQVADGILVTVNGPLTITLSNWMTDVVLDTAAVDVIPEPATIVLLAIGGLALRRR